MTGAGIAVIIGAGPAGLTAAYELLTRTSIRPIVLEASDVVGGISRTVVYKGNRIDIGGHRFFSKSNRVMDWWLARLPVEKGGSGAEIMYHGQHRALGATPESNGERVFLVRPRKSRIYFLRQFFDYPLKLAPESLWKLGIARSIRIGLSYIHRSVFPLKNETTLEHFFINRFGEELYETFFKSYTEKVWGVSCTELPASWGAQRVKGLSIRTAIEHALKGLLKRGNDLGQKGTETSLIERFLYPRLGPGQMWDVVAEEVLKLGGEILTGRSVDRIEIADSKVVAVDTTGEHGRERFPADYFFSTMALRDLCSAVGDAVPEAAREVAMGLVYRDFVIVGILVDGLEPAPPPGKKFIDDNWLYIQESDVKVGRMQIFNNWSESLVGDPDKIWIGFEYFCNKGDELWEKDERAMIDLAVEEGERIGLLLRSRVRDACVIRQEKTYPSYHGSYDRFDVLRGWLDSIENLFPVGRNGMHRYNNQDHSMPTAMEAVDNIIAGRTDKANLWLVNTEQEYHEVKSETPEKKPSA